MLTVIVVRGKRVRRKSEQGTGKWERIAGRGRIPDAKRYVRCRVGFSKVYIVHTMCLVASITYDICINYLVLGMQICTLVQQQGTYRGVAIIRCLVKGRIFKELKV